VPFEDLTGNSGFTSDSEGANVNLDITMSDDSARNLWDVQAAIQQIAADLQTAVRSAADFQSYLISIRETSQTIRMPSLGMEGGEGGNMSYSGGRVDTGSVPLIQSELGMASRIGEMEENASGAGGGAMAARNPGERPFDAGEAVSQMTNLAWMASMTGSHNAPPETVAAYEREYQFALSNTRNAQVRRASFGGQTGTPRAYAASQIVRQGLPAAQQFLHGGGLGGAASMLGRLGTYGAIGYAAYQLVDAGLETYAQSRAMAISTNNSDHGIGWGFGTRVSQAGMAMSPFVSQEDAAQIYQAAIEQGWASRESGGFGQGDFSSAVNFMYGAAKDYNMDPAMSAQLLQTNTLEAGQSVAALSQQLLTLKQTLDGTGVSMAAATGAFTSATSFFIGAGASPADAAIISGGMLKSFSGNTVLGPNAAGLQMSVSAMQNPGLQNVIGALNGNLGAAAFAGPNARQGVETYQKLLHTLAKQYSSQTGTSWENRVAMFMTSYGHLTGQQIDFNKGEQLMTEAAADPEFMTRGEDDFVAATSMSGLQHQNWGQQGFHGFDAALESSFGSGSHQNSTAAINSHEYWNEEVNNLLLNSGDNLGNLTLYGPNGKPVSMNGRQVSGADIASWFNSQENYAKFNDPKGGYYIQDQTDKSKNPNKYNYSNIGLGGSNAEASAGGGRDKNTLYITLSDQAKTLININRDTFPLDDGTG